LSMPTVGMALPARMATKSTGVDGRLKGRPYNYPLTIHNSKFIFFTQNL